MVGSHVIEQVNKLLHLRHQAGQIPLFGGELRVDVGINNVVHGALAIADHLLLQLPAFEHPAPFGIDSPTLIIHHLVVLKHLFTDVVVIGFHLLLGPLQGAGEHARFDRHVLLHPEGIHQPSHPIAAEDAQQVVFQGEEEAGAAGVALAAGATTQLVIDPA